MYAHKVALKKLKSLGLVLMEGKLLRRLAVNVKIFWVWLDRKIGNITRFCVMPFYKVKNNSILFLPLQHGVACNPKYISDELIRRKLPIDIYWSVNRAQYAKMKVDHIYSKLAPDGIIDEEDPDYNALQEYVKEHVHFVRPNSLAYFQAAGSAKVLVTNELLGDKFYPFPIKKSQITTETWHGSLGIKRFDLSHYKTNLSWPEAAKRTGRLTSYCFSNSTFEENVFRETFWEKTPMLRLGHARNDIFFDNYENMRKFLRNEFIVKHPSLTRVEEGQEEAPEYQFALYAPTFRDSHNFNVFKLDPEMVLEALRDRFGGHWKLLVRYHNNDKKTGAAKKNTIKSPDVINVTSYPDMQELLSFTDVAITDYSSWIFDFVLTGKPGFIFAMDIDEYYNERGFYFGFEDTPFTVAKDSETLAENIRNFDAESYPAKVKAFLDDKECVDDGHASERIADQIEEWMGLH